MMWPFYFNKPVSRVLYLFEEVSIIYLAHPLLNESNNLPWDQMRRDTSFPLFGLAPHRVYLVSLQHYLYILSVALVLTSRWTGVTRYAALWCPDFPHHTKCGAIERFVKCKITYFSIELPTEVISLL